MLVTVLDDFLIVVLHELKLYFAQTSPKAIAMSRSTINQGLQGLKDASISQSVPTMYLISLLVYI